MEGNANDMSVHDSPDGGRGGHDGNSHLNYSQDNIDARNKSLADVKKKRKE